MAFRVTLSAIAARTGYSKNSVSLALRDDPQLPAQTRNRIRKVAETMGYRPNALVSHLMAQLRASQSVPFQAKLALINAHRSPDALRHHPELAPLAEGCAQRASLLGYSFDPFWLHEAEMTAARLVQIFETRSIRGIVIAGLQQQNRLPGRWQEVWDRFPAVAAGIRLSEPALSFSSADHYRLTLGALEKALELGYRRPALVIDDVYDRLVERRFSASMQAGQEVLPEAHRIPSFLGPWREPAGLRALREWFDRNRPDVILGRESDVMGGLELEPGAESSPPGFISLEWRSAQPEFAGMNPHNDLIGRAAVDLLVRQIHRNQMGLPDFPEGTLIGATWTEGASVCNRRRAGPAEELLETALSRV